MDGYWERVAKRGKDDSPYRAAFAQVICVADTDAEAERLYAEHVLYFYNRCLHVYPGFADPPGYRTIDTLKNARSSQALPGSTGRLPERHVGQLVDGRIVIAGGPGTSAALEEASPGCASVTSSASSTSGT